MMESDEEEEVEAGSGGDEEQNMDAESAEDDDQALLTSECEAGFQKDLPASVLSLVRNLNTMIAEDTDLVKSLNLP